MVAPGVQTQELDRVAEKRATERGARPAFKGYRGYPASLCASINRKWCTGFRQSGRKLNEGDIVSLDYGVELDGYFGDAAVTVPVGKVRPELETLMRVTRESLDLRHRKGAAGQPVERRRRRSAAMGGAATGFRWCASLWATESAPKCTKSPAC